RGRAQGARCRLLQLRALARGADAEVDASPGGGGAGTAGEARMKRREFLAQSSVLAAGALGASSTAHAGGPSRVYDIIIVGAGAAGCIVARRLVDRFPGKSILLLEAGGPTSTTVGGRDFPPYDHQATIF